MKKMILVILMSMVAYADVDIPSNKCALIVASRPSMSEVRAYVRDKIDDKRYVTIYQSYNGQYAISRGFLTEYEKNRVISKWINQGKIPDDSFCAKSSKFRREVDLELGSYTSSVDKNIDTIQAMFDYKVVGNKVYLSVEVRNYYDRYKRGGLTISFPQFHDRYSSDIRVSSSRGFESVDKYPPYSQIYSRELGYNMRSKYFVVEGWNDYWNDTGTRSIDLVVDTQGKDRLIANIRVVVRGRYETIAIPTKGPLDQQGYHAKRVVIDISKSTESSSDATYATNSYGGCSQSSKPILACSPSERSDKAFSMCAVSMGGCEIAVNLLESSNERYVASQACAAYSAKLMGQKYTLDDMLGTFFIDVVDEYANKQLKSDDPWAQGFGVLLKVGTVGAKLQQLNQCVQNAKRNCSRKYEIWQRNCR